MHQIQYVKKIAMLIACCMMSAGFVYAASNIPKERTIEMFGMQFVLKNTFTPKYFPKTRNELVAILNQKVNPGEIDVSKVDDMSFLFAKHPPIKPPFKEDDNMKSYPLEIVFDTKSKKNIVTFFFGGYYSDEFDENSPTITNYLNNAYEHITSYGLNFSDMYYEIMDLENKLASYTLCKNNHARFVAKIDKQISWLTHLKHPNYERAKELEKLKSCNFIKQKQAQAKLATLKKELYPVLDSALQQIKGFAFWDTSNVKNMRGLFFEGVLDPIFVVVMLSSWDTSNVRDMSYMFARILDPALWENLPIAHLNTSNVRDMSYMFANSNVSASDTIALEALDVGKVENMRGMFVSVTWFNRPLGAWNTSNVRDMSYMFAGVREFNQNIESWDTSNVRDMSYMFYSCWPEGSYYQFNSPLNGWNVGKVKNMREMFACSNFNQPLDKWNVENVTDMEYMFYESLFNQNLDTWKVSIPKEKLCTMFDKVGIFYDYPSDYPYPKWFDENLCRSLTN